MKTRVLIIAFDSGMDHVVNFGSPAQGRSLWAGDPYEDKAGLYYAYQAARKVLGENGKVIVKLVCSNPMLDCRKGCTRPSNGLDHRKKYILCIY